RDAAVAVNPDIIVLCHGGPIAEAEDAQYVLSRTEGVVGFFGASSIERLPTEVSIRAQTEKFKHIDVGWPWQGGTEGCRRAARADEGRRGRASVVAGVVGDSGGLRTAQGYGPLPRAAPDPGCDQRDHPDAADPRGGR